MSDRQASTSLESQRTQPAMWPWGVALSFALLGSGWWAWDLFKSPTEDTGHPRLPTLGGTAPHAAPARDVLSSAPTASGRAASAPAAPQQGSETRLP